MPRFTSISSRLADGASAATVFFPAAFGVINTVMKATPVDFFINLGTTNTFTATDYVDHGLFAAHELADNFVYQSLFDQWLNSFRRFHGHSLVLLSIANDRTNCRERKSAWECGKLPQANRHEIWREDVE